MKSFLILIFLLVQDGDISKPEIYVTAHKDQVACNEYAKRLIPELKKQLADHPKKDNLLVDVQCIEGKDFSLVEAQKKAD